MLNYPIDPKRIPEQVRQILARLDGHGFETWLVGGCVRDLCLGLDPKDFDLATSARPEQVQQIFSRHYATGLQHGTVTVIWRELAVEITTFRTEGTYTDSRRPDLVIFHDQIDADLARRDFTMNSMAWRPDRGLLDLHGGLDDLNRQILRTVGDPIARFDEDALRLLRAVRFAVTYDLTPDPQIIAAATRLAYRLSRLSRERITAEILKIMGAPYPRQLLAFAGCGLISASVHLLLHILADDQVLCQRLSQLANSQLSLDQRLPLLFLASAAPTLSPDGLRQTLLPYFRASAGHRLQHLLMHECRVSRQQAQASEAMLYLLCLRLLLPLEKDLERPNQRRLLRLLARRCHLATSELDPVILAASQLIKLCLPRLNRPFMSNQQLFILLQDEPVPLTLADLAINGRRLQAAGWPPGPALRMMLERLLSRIVECPENNNSMYLTSFSEQLNRYQNMKKYK